MHAHRTDYYEGLEPLPKAESLLTDEGVYALVWSRVPVRERDGVEPIPGRPPLSRKSAAYWATGVVGAINRASDVDRVLRAQEFLLVAAGAHFVTRSSLPKRNQVVAGERVSVECNFELVAAHDWSALELPDEWSGDWLVKQTIRVGAAAQENYALDLTPVHWALT